MKKIRFGIVGPGNIAHRFANAIKNVPNAELTAVASRNIDNANKFGDEFNIPHRFEGYEMMAKSDVIDAAYIAVPHSGHAEYSIMFMNHGKHVISEKPMAVNAKEVREMIDCAKTNKVFLVEGMWARFVPGTLKLHEIIESGILGDIKGVEGKFCYSFDEDEMDHHALKVENGGGHSLMSVAIAYILQAGISVRMLKIFVQLLINTEALTVTCVHLLNTKMVLSLTFQARYY